MYLYPLYITTTIESKPIPNILTIKRIILRYIYTPTDTVQSSLRTSLKPGDMVKVQSSLRTSLKPKMATRRRNRKVCIIVLLDFAYYWVNINHNNKIKRRSHEEDKIDKKKQKCSNVISDNNNNNVHPDIVKPQAKSPTIKSTKRRSHVCCYILLKSKSIKQF